ncbi:hypothetical protein Goklo_000629 [Gossypium klotzschianum]|uniref:Uncharacterized protein n=1 Tax=Gossypium klotzschianum TaxID=34286 RepID=A0A7J8VY58_9ROSI|nr:hypothetical protein [Gossypium klotzschianum]
MWIISCGGWKTISVKSEERSVCEKDYKEYVDGNGNDDNSGNGKPRFGKKKPKRKRDKLKYFLCDGPHMLKKCLKKSALKEKLVGKALVLSSSAKGVEAKKAENKKPKKLALSKGKAKANRAKRSKKKRVKFFLYRGRMSCETVQSKP